MSKTPKEWLDKIEDERKKGNICFMTLEGLSSMPLNDFIQQPAEGILYDLNRLPEVVACWIEGDKKWVNDYAVGATIKYLKEQNEVLCSEQDALQKKLERAMEIARESMHRLRNNVCKDELTALIIIGEFEKAIRELDGE